MSQETEQFPRSKILPVQSPLFWVEQKDRYLRQLMIRDIEQITNRRLCVYFANRFEGAQIDGRDVAFLAELLSDLEGSPLDLLLETNGGLTDATDALVSLLQEIAQDLRVIVVNAAKSNGTLLCLAAKCILMGCTSELGPIEPQVNGIPCCVLERQEVAAQNFVLHMAGIYALNQSKALAKKLLSNGMMRGKAEKDIEDTVRKLGSRDVYFSHGSVINAKEASELGLNVEYMENDSDLWKRLWFLYAMYEHDCNRSGLLKVFEGRRISAAVSVSRADAPASA